MLSKKKKNVFFVSFFYLANSRLAVRRKRTKCDHYFVFFGRALNQIVILGGLCMVIKADNYGIANNFYFCSYYVDTRPQHQPKEVIDGH
jgi:hypothetical protein